MHKLSILSKAKSEKIYILKKFEKLGLEFLSCYLGVAASRGYFGAVAVVFSTSLVSLLLFHAPTPVRLSYLALH